MLVLIGYFFLLPLEVSLDDLNFCLKLMGWIYSEKTFLSVEDNLEVDYSREKKKSYETVRFLLIENVFEELEILTV